LSTRSLSQAEAERRAALLAVRQYEVAVDLTGTVTGPQVRCVSTITFSCREPGAETFVDCAAEVLTATLNGAPLGPAADGRIPLPGLTAENELIVESVQANTADGEGVHKATDPADGEVYVWTSFEPDMARYVWACFDQPDLKAPHVFVVTAPAAWTVTSNSGDPAIEDQGAARIWTFPATPALASYNTVVNAGPLHEIRREAGGYDLGLFARRSLAAVLDRDADNLFTWTEQGLGFFGDVFGMPFPQRKYDQVFMPEFGGAMENYGCVTWTDGALIRTPPTPAEQGDVALVLLHEMAHMWFGNIVTMRWWDDLWLNEAFAEFACHWAASRATAFTDAWVGHLITGEIRAYLADQGPKSHPIRLPIPDVAAAASIFDEITYPKGASVLEQLMIYVGEPNFTAGMKAYFAKYAWGNTTLQDLIDELAATSGRDLDEWRTGWLETAGTDRLTLESEGGTLVLAARGPGGGPARPQVLAVGAYSRRDGRLERTGVAEVEVHGPRTTVELPAGADLYLVNDEDLTFATTRPDAGTRDALFATAGQLPTPIARGVAVATAWDMLTTGEATAAEVVSCLTGVLATETSDSVIQPYLDLAAEATKLWAGDADRSRLMAEVAAAGAALAKEPANRRLALRTLARTAPGLEDVARLQAEAGDDVDLQWRLLIRKAQLGGDTAAEVAALEARDPDPDARMQVFAVRAATPSAGEKEAVWQALVDRTIPVGTAAAVTGSFWVPGQDELLAPYAERYLEVLPTLERGGMIPARLYSARLFPLFGIDAGYLTRVEQAARQTAPVVRETVLGRSDVVRRMLRSRG
jgi:aminopeptidase N